MPSPARRSPGSLAVDETGSMAMFMALSMFALLGVSALAIDLARQLNADIELAHSTDLACARFAAFYHENLDDEHRRRSAFRQFEAQKEILGLGDWGTKAEIERGETVSRMVTSGSGRATFARMFGIDHLDVRDSRTCKLPGPNAGEGETLFADGFEDVLISAGAWTVLQSTKNWRVTRGAGVEIQASTVFSAPEGNNYAELDSHASRSFNNAGRATNSAITTSIEFPQGYFELHYKYLSRVNSATTNIIFVYLDADGETPGSNRIDEALYSSVWEERSVPIRISSPGLYHLTFEASGREDTVGGLIDDIRILFASPKPS